MRLLGCFFTAAACRKLIIGLMLLGIANQAHALDGLAPSVWDSTSESGCRTTLTFLSDEEYMLESSDQIVMKAYKLTKYRRTEFFVFFQRTVANNEQLSCAGIKAARTGTRLKFYAKFNADMTELAVYPEPDENSQISIEYVKRGS